MAPRKQPSHRGKLIAATVVLLAVAAGGAVWWMTRGCNTMDYAGTCVEDSGNPTILDAAPAEGEPAGGNAIEINGKHFGPGIQVWFGDQPATQVSVINSVRLKVVVPPTTTPHLVDISLARGNGPKAVLAGGYRYETDMEIESVEPLTGSAAGGTKVTIHGHGFAPDTRVDFGGTQSQIAEYRDPTTIVATTTPHQAGPAVINIRTGEDEQTYEAPFTYK